MSFHHHRRHITHVIIPWIALPTSLLVSFISIYKLPAVTLSQSVILNFLASLVVFLANNIEAFIIFYTFYCLWTFFIVTRHTIPRRPKALHHAIRVTVGNTILAGLLSILFGFLIIYGFGIVNVYLISAQINTNPQKFSIAWGNDTIARRIHSDQIPPAILETNYEDLEAQIVSRILEQGSTGRFYKDVIAGNIVHTFAIGLHIPKQSLTLVGNTLLVSELNKSDLTAVSPVLGNVLVAQYFKPRPIKSYPEVTVLNRQEYLQLRENQIDIHLGKIDQLIKQIEEAVQTDTNDIKTDNSKITTNKNGLTSSLNERDAEYKNCIAAGFDTYCERAKSDWDTLIAAWQKNISDWSAQLTFDQQQLASDQRYQTSVSQMRSTVADQKDQIPAELGVFEGSDGRIDIALDWQNSASIYAYLETLTHEYLHYASFVSDGQKLPSFFEEGLTEYFARKIIEQEEGREMAIGYPLYVALIGQMATKIPDTVLSDIYFSKNQAQLIKQLDTAFGDKFYEKNEMNFSLLPYLPDNKALELANSLMVQFGGPKLTKI